MSVKRDALDSIADIKCGLSALMSIQSAVAECDPSPDYGAGLFYVLSHLITEADALEKQLQEAAAASQAPRA